MGSLRDLAAVQPTIPKERSVTIDDDGGMHTYVNYYMVSHGSVGPSKTYSSGRYYYRYKHHSDSLSLDCHAYPSCSIRAPPRCAVGRFISRRVYASPAKPALAGGVLPLLSSGGSRGGPQGAMAPPKRILKKIFFTPPKKVKKNFFMLH